MSDCIDDCREEKDFSSGISQRVQRRGRSVMLIEVKKKKRVVPEQRVLFLSALLPHQSRTVSNWIRSRRIIIPARKKGMQ